MQVNVIINNIIKLFVRLIWFKSLKVLQIKVPCILSPMHKQNIVAQINLSVSFIKYQIRNRNYCPTIRGYKIKLQRKQNIHCNVVKQTKVKGQYKN